MFSQADTVSFTRVRVLNATSFSPYVKLTPDKANNEKAKRDMSARFSIPFRVCLTWIPARLFVTNFQSLNQSVRPSLSFFSLPIFFPIPPFLPSIVVLWISLPLSRFYRGSFALPSQFVRTCRRVVFSSLAYLVSLFPPSLVR